MKHEPTMGFWGVALVGLIPIGLIVSAVILMRHFAGSWEETFKWGVFVVAGLSVLTIGSFLSAILGHTIMYGSLDQQEAGKGGLSKATVVWRERRTEKAAAREAAKRQDGQISVTDDVLGRVSLGDAEGRK